MVNNTGSKRGIVTRLLSVLPLSFLGFLVISSPASQRAVLTGVSMATRAVYGAWNMSLTQMPVVTMPSVSMWKLS